MLSFFLGAFFVFVSVVILVGAARDWGYQRGFQDAEDAQAKASSDWWMKAEAEVEQAREEIWREKR
jgi:hypothetical protein